MPDPESGNPNFNAEGMALDSSLHWLGRVQAVPALRAHVPETRVVELTAHAIDLLTHDEKVHPARQRRWLKLVEKVAHACEEVGYPCFLRSDLQSAKTDGPYAYRIDRAEQAASRILATIEGNILKDEYPATLLVRKWLDLKGPFTAFHGHLIAREYRFFATLNGVLCHHFYWMANFLRFYHERRTTEGVILQAGSEEREGWQHELRMLKKPLNKRDLRTLSELSHTAAIAAEDYEPYGGVSKTGSGAWSIDFAQDVNGYWWLIDMARARRSWHPRSCSVFWATPLLQDDRPGGLERQGGPRQLPKRAHPIAMAHPVTGAA